MMVYSRLRTKLPGCDCGKVFEGAQRKLFSKSFLWKRAFLLIVFLCTYICKEKTTKEVDRARKEKSNFASGREDMCCRKATTASTYGGKCNFCTSVRLPASAGQV